MRSKSASYLPASTSGLRQNACVTSCLETGKELVQRVEREAFVSGIHSASAKAKVYLPPAAWDSRMPST